MTKIQNPLQILIVFYFKNLNKYYLLVELDS